MLANDGPSKDFISDAFAHCKFMGIGVDAKPLFDGARVSADLDEGCVPLVSAEDAAMFVTACRDLRYWPREMNVDLDAASFSR